MRTLLGMGVLAATSLAATSASAATIVGSPSSSSGDAGIYFTYAANLGGVFGNNDPTATTGKFSDQFTFTTTIERIASVIVSSSMPIGDFSRNVNFVSNGVTLNGTVVPVSTTGLNELRTLLNFRLPAGTSTISIAGSAGTNGSYIGQLLLAGVPEPATWAMMILGLGAVGGVMRARRRTTARVRFA